MDTVLIGVLATFAVGGVWKGGIKTMFSLISFAAAFFLAYYLYPPIAEKLFNARLLSNSLTDCVTDMLSGLNQQLVGRVFSSVDDMIAWISGLDLPYYGKNVLLSILGNVSFNGDFTVSQIVANPLYKFMLEAISFVIIFVLLFVLFKILQLFLQKLVRFEFLKVTDKVLGFLIGTAFGIAIYFVIVYFLTMVSNVLLSDFLIGKLKDGYLSSIFYERIIS